jgi:hypothetical protein
MVAKDGVRLLIVTVSGLLGLAAVAWVAGCGTRTEPTTVDTTTSSATLSSETCREASTVGTQPVATTTSPAAVTEASRAFPKLIDLA